MGLLSRYICNYDEGIVPCYQVMGSEHSSRVGPGCGVGGRVAVGISGVKVFMKGMSRFPGRLQEVYLQNEA